MHKFAISFAILFILSLGIISIFHLTHAQQNMTIPATSSKDIQSTEDTDTNTNNSLIETSVFNLNKQNTNDTDLFDQRNDLIPNDFLTYYNESLGIKIDYPNYWVISTKGNGSLTFATPIGIGGLTINKINQNNLNSFLSKRINLLRHSSNEVQIIDSKDITLYGKNTVAKSLIYLLRDKNNFFKAAEIMVKGNNKNIFQISFISNSSLFDSFAPVVNKMLTSMATLSHENATISDNNDNKNNNSTFTSTSKTLTIPQGASTEGNPSYAPATLTVNKGDIITVENSDNTPHTVTSGATPDDPQVGKLFDTSLIMPGKYEKINTAKLKSGTYSFHCIAHPYMKGTFIIK